MRRVDKGRKGRHKWRKPLSAVNQFGNFKTDVLLKMIGVAVQTQVFEHFVGKVQNAAAGSFVYAAAFHADDAVFDNIRNADSVAPTDFV